MKTVKTQLKQLAFDIRELKNKIRTTMQSGAYAGRDQFALMQLKHHFRHKHIAYCLMRGRTIDEIEGNAKTPRDQAYINTLLEQFKELSHEAVCAG